MHGQILNAKVIEDTEDEGCYTRKKYTKKDKVTKASLIMSDYNCQLIVEPLSRFYWHFR